MGIDSWDSNRSAPKIRVSVSRGTNGYIVMNTERHLGQFPHQEEERFRLQLLKRSKNSGDFENNFPI
jgi:hypothetical protein